MNTGDCFYGDECSFLHEKDGNVQSIGNFNNLFDKASGESNLLINQFNQQIPSESKLSGYLSDIKLNDNGPSSKILNAAEKTKPFIPSRNFQNLALDSNMNSSNHQKRQNSGNSANYFVFNEDIKLEALKKNNFLSNLNNGEMFTEIPSQVGTYIDLYPLDGAITTPSSCFNLITTIYKAINIKTGKTVCLRRIHSFTLSKSGLDKGLLLKIKEWKQLNHSNIVKFYEVFITKEFGDNSLVFVYDFHAASKTLLAQYYFNSNTSFSSKNSSSTVNRPYSQQQQAQRQKLLPESHIWSYIIQLISALRAIHSKGLAARIVDVKKILITSGFPPSDNASQSSQGIYPRIKLNCCCIMDVITNEIIKEEMNIQGAKNHTLIVQKEDLVMAGKVLLSIVTNSYSPISDSNTMDTLNSISRYYSDDLIMLVYKLLAIKRNEITEDKDRSIAIIDTQLTPLMGARFYEQLDHVYQKNDCLENELCKEMDNSRLFRLLAKLGCINERPELGMNEKWSETGDRYLLKLFRDYIFHQNKEDGSPFVDLGHIISTLNKLDAGSKEKLCLSSRDGQNVIIVTFAELKKCIENSFQQLIT